MKRREFIINSAILAGGATHLGGCNKKELIKSENQITRRKLIIFTAAGAVFLGAIKLGIETNSI